MRDRLIELIAGKTCRQYVKDNCSSKWNGCCGECECGRDFQIGDIADTILADGWTRPPCYIGQEIWHVSKHYDGRIEVGKGKVSMLQQKADKSWKIRITVNSSSWDFTPNEIGTRYFFSKEEAVLKTKNVNN